MTPESTELARIAGLVLEIDKKFTAKADARPDWPNRQIEVEIKQGRRVVYHQIIGLGDEAKARLVRHELTELLESDVVPAIKLEVA